VKKLALSLLILLLPNASSAEMVKSFTLDCKGICLHWWPKLPPIKGWHQDVDVSYHDNINVLVPDGHKFADADAVMYANAIYKSRVPEDKTLDHFIEGDKEKFLSDHPKMEIMELGRLTTGDGKSLRSLSFVLKDEGWERVSYGEEGDFYLVFTLSSRSQKGYDETMGTYEKLVESYREKNSVH